MDPRANKYQRVFSLSSELHLHVYFFVLFISCFDIGRFYTKDALSVWTNLGKYFVVRLGYASLV